MAEWVELPADGRLDAKSFIQPRMPLRHLLKHRANSGKRLIMRHPAATNKLQASLCNKLPNYSLLAGTLLPKPACKEASF